MHLTLLVPGLLWPREILRDTLFDLPLPALSLLLGRGHQQSVPPAEEWLAERFGLELPLPTAPLRLLGLGAEPGEAHWLCLDPVHLRIGERAVVLDDPSRLALDADEDAALRAALAPLLAPLGELVAPAPGRWHLRLVRAAALETRPLPEAAGSAADPEHPGGTEGGHWRRLLAEAQLLLHAHPVNRAREEAGRPTANSLWPWGQGRLPAGAGGDFDAVWTSEPALRGLGAAAGIAVAPLPAAFAVAPGRVLARLDELAAPAAAGDALAWREGIARLEAGWFAPAAAALKAGRCRRIALIASGPGRAIKTSLDRADAWKFWKKPLPLTELAP